MAASTPNVMLTIAMFTTLSVAIVTAAGNGTATPTISPNTTTASLSSTLAATTTTPAPGTTTITATTQPAANTTITTPTSTITATATTTASVVSNSTETTAITTTAQSAATTTITTTTTTAPVVDTSTVGLTATTADETATANGTTTSATTSLPMPNATGDVTSTTNTTTTVVTIRTEYSTPEADSVLSVEQTFDLAFNPEWSDEGSAENSEFERLMKKALEPLYNTSESFLRITILNTTEYTSTSSRARRSSAGGTTVSYQVYYSMGTDNSKIISRVLHYLAENDNKLEFNQTMITDQRKLSFPGVLASTAWTCNTETDAGYTLVNCSGQGSCNSSSGYPRCVCNEEYEGFDCSTVKEEGTNPNTNTECAKPPKVNGASIIPNRISYEAGSQVTYKCNEEYEMNCDSPVATCTQLKSWSFDSCVPQCMKSYKDKGLVDEDIIILCASIGGVAGLLLILLTICCIANKWYYRCKSKEKAPKSHSIANLPIDSFHGTSVYHNKGGYEVRVPGTFKEDTTLFNRQSQVSDVEGDTPVRTSMPESMTAVTDLDACTAENSVMAENGLTVENHSGTDANSNDKEVNGEAAVVTVVDEVAPANSEVDQKDVFIAEQSDVVIAEQSDVVIAEQSDIAIADPPAQEGE